MALKLQEDQFLARCHNKRTDNDTHILRQSVNSTVQNRKCGSLRIAKVHPSHYENMSVQYTAIFHGCKKIIFR